MTKILLNKLHEHGQSLFEVVFAIGIAALIVLGILTLSSRSVSDSTLSRHNTLATQYVSDALEWIRSERDSSWTNFVGNISTGSPGYLFCLKDSPLSSSSWNQPSACTAAQPISGTIFYRKVTFSCYQQYPVKTSYACNNSLVDLVEADVVVSWTDSKGTHNAESKGTFSNWRN